MKFEINPFRDTGRNSSSSGMSRTGAWFLYGLTAFSQITKVDAAPINSSLVKSGESIIATPDHVHVDWTSVTANTHESPKPSHTTDTLISHITTVPIKDWTSVNPTNAHESPDTSKYLDIIVPHESTLQTSVSEVKASETPQPKESKERPSAATIDSFGELAAKYPGMLEKALYAMCQEDPEFRKICESISRKLQKTDGSQPSESSSERNSLKPGNDDVQDRGPDSGQKYLRRSQQDHMEHLQSDIKKITEASWKHLLELSKRQDFSQADFASFLKNYYDLLVDDVNRLTSTTNDNFKNVNQDFANVDQKFNTVDQKFNTVDQKFNTTDQKFDNVDSSLENKIDLSKLVIADWMCMNVGASLGIAWGLTIVPWRGIGRSVRDTTVAGYNAARGIPSAARRALNWLSTPRMRRLVPIRVPQGEDNIALVPPRTAHLRPENAV